MRVLRPTSAEAPADAGDDQEDNMPVKKEFMP